MYVKHNPEKTMIKISLLLSGQCLKWRRERREDMGEGGANKRTKIYRVKERDK